MGKRKTGENQQAGGSILMSRGGSILESAKDEGTDPETATKEIDEAVKAARRA